MTLSSTSKAIGQFSMNFVSLLHRPLHSAYQDVSVPVRMICSHFIVVGAWPLITELHGCYEHLLAISGRVFIKRICFVCHLGGINKSFRGK